MASISRSLKPASHLSRGRRTGGPRRTDSGSSISSITSARSSKSEDQFVFSPGPCTTKEQQLAASSSMVDGASSTAGQSNTTGTQAVIFVSPCLLSPSTAVWISDSLAVILPSGHYAFLQVHLSSLPLLLSGWQLLLFIIGFIPHDQRGRAFATGQQSLTVAVCWRCSR